MDDLPAMAPCPHSKHGGHELSVILPEDSTGEVTFFCAHCGALRRVPMSGQLLPIDNLSADEIAALFRP